MLQEKFRFIYCLTLKQNNNLIKLLTVIIKILSINRWLRKKSQKIKMYTLTEHNKTNEILIGSEK